MQFAYLGMKKNTLPISPSTCCLYDQFIYIQVDENNYKIGREDTFDLESIVSLRVGWVVGLNQATNDFAKIFMGWVESWVGWF